MLWKALNKDQFNDHMKSFNIQQELNRHSTHPFICSFEYILENEHRVYIISELLSGGELESLIKSKGTLSEELVKFYTAQLVLAIGFLHSKDIVYRNLKTSAILINSDGYVKIGDFDWWGKLVKNTVSNSFVSTNEYQAPEIVNNEGHDKTIDWWALGVIMWQMLFEYEVVEDKKLHIPEDSKISDEAKSLISMLLEEERQSRLGAQNDADEILDHPFFSDIDKDALLNKDIKPPYIPFIHPKDPYYVANFNLDFADRAPRESIINDIEN